jgi:hypothetical protein
MNKRKNISLFIIFALLIFVMTAVITPYSAFAQAPPTIVDPFADDDEPPSLTLPEAEEDEDEPDVPAPEPPPVTAPVAPAPVAPAPVAPTPVYIPPAAPVTTAPATIAAPVHASSVVGDEVPDSGPEVYLLFITALILGGGYYKMKEKFSK